MPVSETAFANDITLAPKIIKRLENRNQTKVIEQLKDFRLAFGLLRGFYHMNEYNEIVNGNDDYLSYLHRGPYEEAALADMYGIFYKSGTLDWEALGGKSCSWYNQLPSGQCAWMKISGAQFNAKS